MEMNVSSDFIVTKLIIFIKVNNAKCHGKCQCNKNNHTTLYPLKPCKLTAKYDVIKLWQPTTQNCHFVTTVENHGGTSTVVQSLKKAKGKVLGTRLQGSYQRKHFDNDCNGM